MAVLPNLFYRFNTSPIKIPASYFVGINKLLLKVIHSEKRLRIDNTILKEKNKAGELTVPDFKTYHSGTSLVVQWLRHRTSTAGGTGSTPGQGTMIPHAEWPKRKKKVKKKDITQSYSNQDRVIFAKEQTNRSME